MKGTATTPKYSWHLGDKDVIQNRLYVLFPILDTRPKVPAQITLVTQENSRNTQYLAGSLRRQKRHEKFAQKKINMKNFNLVQGN